MTRLSRTELKRQLKYLFTLVTVFLTTAGTLFAACTASEKNADYSEVGTNSASVNAVIQAPGDLVAITAWCYANCTPGTVMLGSQSAVKIALNPGDGTGNPGTGQGFIYYILSASAAGSQTLTFTQSGGSQSQVSYIDFTPSAGCTFSHDVDAPLGDCLSSCNSNVNAPTITTTAGDLLFDFTWSSEHVNDINSPWSCPVYSGSGETQDCQFNTTRNVAAYILSASPGSTTNSATTTHPTDLWQAMITSFSLTSGSSGGSGGSGTSGNVHYIAANGSDTNSGTSKSSPWLHAPGMPSCTSNCAAYKPAAGDQIIFRGGDTWHFGNSALSPYTGGTWNWNSVGVNGASGNPIYVGVDQTWFSGGSWTRPILSGDNPVCNSTLPSGCSTSTLSAPNGSTITQYYVASCAHQILPSGSNIMVDFTSRKYFTFDNFELTGLCQSSAGQPSNYDVYIRYGSANGPLTFSNNYLHGWSHTKYAGANSSAACNNGVCINVRIFSGSVLSGPGENLLYDVVDGSDSDPVGAEFAYTGLYNVAYSVIRYTSDAITTTFHLFHDNLYEYFFENGHSNVFESSNTEFAGTNALYNNVFRHIESSGGNGGVMLWLYPPSGTKDYVFNNVAYDVGSLEYLNTGNSGSSLGSYFYFNNTWQSNVSQLIIRCENLNGTMVEANNQYITDGGAYKNGCASPTTSLTPLLMSNATASADGYSSSQVYAYSPTSGTSPTVGTGTNQQAYCTALSAAGLTDAATACQSDTTYSCTYNTTNHSVSCPARTTVARPATAWNIGGYQQSSVQAAGPNAPTGLIAIVQ